MAHSPFPDHPLRQMLAGEIHARPFEQAVPPLRASHLAILHQGDEETERAVLKDLLAPHGAELPAPGTIHMIRDLGALRLRWERHTEFSTYTFLRNDGFDAPFDATALDLVPQVWLSQLPGPVIAAVHLAFEDQPRDSDAVAAFFAGNQLVGSIVQDGAAEIWSDFRIHADGFGRILIRNRALSPGQSGRLLQRVCDLETYRLMALLALPDAKQVHGAVSRIDRALADIITNIASAGGLESERDLLDQLTRLAAETEQMDAATSFRLGAARAYWAIVQQRIGTLREVRISGFQTIGEFMERRLAPAMKTCDSASERQGTLSERVARASDLLRTRVNIALSENNRDLLRSMDARVSMQLQLQETVEGLSVVAISYYLMGLVGYANKGLKSIGIGIDPDLFTLIALPIIVGATYVAVKRLRHALSHHTHQADTPKE